MDREEFYDDIYKKVHNLNILDIVKDEMNLKYKSGNYWGICPFHNDKRLGNFSVSKEKNMFKCFACDEGGNGIKLYQKIKGIRYYKDAVVDIALNFGFISLSEYEEFYGLHNSYKRYDKKKTKKILIKAKEKVEETPKADINTLNKVYSIFKKVAGLSKAHKKYLIEERRLKKNELGDYLTMPNNKKYNEFVDSLKENGMTENDLKGVPGFFYDINKKRWNYYAPKGIGICIKDAFGRIEAIQIRKEKKDFMNRYVWFSSGFASDNEKGLKYGTQTNSPIDVVYPTKIKTTTIFITEGRFKAKILADAFNSVVLSVQGVSTWKNNIDSILKDIPKSFEFGKRYGLKGQPKIRRIFITFDADIALNVQVFQQAMRMSNFLEENFSYEIRYSLWADELGKGVDDMIIAHHKDMLESMDKNLFNKLYIETVEDVLEFQELPYKKKNNELPEFDSKELNKEILKNFYQRNILSKLSKYKDIL